MEQQIKLLMQSFEEQLASAGTSTPALTAVRVKYLGKNGGFTALLKGLKDISPELRPQAGKLVNDARTQAETLLGSAEALAAQQARSAALESERIDVTLPPKITAQGSLHPLTIVKNKILDAFSGLGFEIYDGPEIETDYYSFEALNIPKDHPARDMQDTFYITENIVLRPHTSPAQVRAMKEKGVPIRLLCPGKVYRSDDDATHSPMFHQIEGLAVEQNLSLCDLKGVLLQFARALFSKDAQIRFRPSYFPFTEPSVEVDVSCAMCKGSGCRLCKNTGWIEILGAGMVHKNVLTGCGVDAEKYRGFAFGMGIERIAMLSYGLPDMRLLFENDIRFLSQFK